MSNQFGFDFGDSIANTFTVNPAGTWLAPKFSTLEYLSIFCKAEAAILRVSGAGRCLLQQGIDSAKEQHAAMLARSSLATEGVYGLWRSKIEPTADELAAFVAHCYAMTGTQHAGFEYKTRRQSHMSTVAMYAQDVGTVIVHQWHDVGIGVDFHPWRDAFFLDSFRDDLPAIYAARSTWAAAYCADKLAYSDSNIASVPTFSLNGREYINDGGYGRGDYYECEGWTFRPLADWRGLTFSYRTQCKAWDEGCLERGDRRGLVVSVRGQHCVLDGVARVYDDKATGDAIYTADEEDAIVDEDFEALTCSY